jgi:hypothetical protein
VRAALADQIDQTAGALRARYITIVPGQEGTYIYKANEARSFKADDSVATPLLTAEAAPTT